MLAGNCVMVRKLKNCWSARVRQVQARFNFVKVHAAILIMTQSSLYFVQFV